MVRAGVLRERLTIQSATGVSDGQGGTTTVTPTTVATVRGELIVRGATELLQAESVGSQARYQFRIRVRAGINAGQTVVWTPQWPAHMPAVTLQIMGVQPEPDRQGLLLTCGVVQ
jgi:head-tail adaptor